jgi:hypothetical protein
VRVHTSILLAGAASVLACAPTGDQASVTALIYGADDRLEYYQAPESAARTLMALSMAAFIPRKYLQVRGSTIEIAAPTWEEQSRLCPGERFAEQPAASFCTGVLVDQELVLTSGHCVRLFALEDFALVFGYYYSGPGKLAVDDVVAPRKILAEALDAEGTRPRLDYAWLRLERPPRPPHRPAELFVRPPPLAAGDRITFIGTGGGIPLKLDGGGEVRDPRRGEGDYFVADSDSIAGASGGGAFDGQATLLGVLSRGGTDYAATPAGCQALARRPSGERAEEELTHSYRAVEALCASASVTGSLCRPDCADRCQATSAEPAGGCALEGRPAPGGAVWLLPLIWAARARRRTIRSIPQAEA